MSVKQNLSRKVKLLKQYHSNERKSYFVACTLHLLQYFVRLQNPWSPGKHLSLPHLPPHPPGASPLPFSLSSYELHGGPSASMTCLLSLTAQLAHFYYLRKVLKRSIIKTTKKQHSTKPHVQLITQVWMYPLLGYTCSSHFLSICCHLQL